MILGTLSTHGTQTVCFLSASPMLVGVFVEMPPCNKMYFLLIDRKLHIFGCDNNYFEG